MDPPLSAVLADWSCGALGQARDAHPRRDVAQPHARSSAMHSSTQVWLARKLQLPTLGC